MKNHFNYHIIMDIYDTYNIKTRKMGSSTIYTIYRDYIFVDATKSLIKATKIIKKYIKADKGLKS